MVAVGKALAETQKNFSEAVVAHIEAVRMESTNHDTTGDFLRQYTKAMDERRERDQDMPPFPPM